MGGKNFGRKKKEKEKFKFYMCRENYLVCMINLNHVHKICTLETTHAMFMHENDGAGVSRAVC